MAIRLPETDSCYFCDIIEGRSDGWNILAEDDLTVAVLNGRQFETGQLMVLPRRHAPTILDLSESEMTAVMRVAKYASGVLVNTFDPDGILIYQNNGVGSGQEVPHFHMHVVPRQQGSDWGLGPPHIAHIARRDSGGKFDHEVDSDAKRATAELIRSSWSGK